MKSIRLFCLVVSMFTIGACAQSESNAVQPATATNDFVFVSTQNATEKVLDVTILNQWLRANTDKKVVSFSAVLAYRDGASGYIMYCVQGDNSRQVFERINRKITSEKESIVHGMDAIQSWKYAFPNFRVVAFTTVAAYSGGVREFTLLYEK